MRPIAFVNGVPGVTVDVADRGFAYGEGVFETLRVTAGKPVWTDLHWQRMAAGCERLGLPWEPARAEASLAQLVRSAADLGLLHGVAKLVYTGGSSGRGYRASVQIQPTIVASWHALPQVDAAVAEAGIDVRLLDTRLAINPRLAGIKHLNRLEQVLAARELGAAELEGLVAATDGRLAEGVASNVFLFMEGRWLTPALTDFGILGVARRFILAHAGARLGAHVEEGDIPVQRLEHCEQAFLVNSVRGVWPLSSIAGRPLEVGIETRRMQAMVAVELQAHV